jgi:hypothetical protein
VKYGALSNADGRVDITTTLPALAVWDVAATGTDGTAAPWKDRRLVTRDWERISMRGSAREAWLR